MKKNTKIILLAAIFISMVVLIYLFSDSPKKKNTFKPDYSKPLKEQVKNAKGAYFMFELLKDFEQVISLKTIQDPISKSLKVKKSSYPTVYCLLDDKVTFSKETSDSLFEFISHGGYAFISTAQLNGNFYKRFFFEYPIKTYKEYYYTLNFKHKDLELSGSYNMEIKINSIVQRYNWHYISSSVFTYDNKAIIISEDTKFERPIFIKIPIGKGWLFLHCVPEAFYNASLFKKEGLAYAESVFSDLPVGHYLWHEHNQKWDKDQDFQEQREKEEFAKTESPLQYIFANTSLKWAYLTMLFSLFLYVVFKIKRKQRVIPAIEPNENKSLSFVETVSNLYLRQEKHFKFIKHYEYAFYSFLRDKYFIPIPLNPEEEYCKLVSLKTEIELEKIKHITNTIKKAKKSYDFSASDLIELHKEIESFYKHCK